MMNRYIALLTLLLGYVLAYGTTPFLGPWHGYLRVATQSLPLVLNVNTDDNEAEPTCTLDSPAQGAKGIPANISIDDTALAVKVDVPMINAKYEGQLVGDKIEGIFSQNGMRLPLVLERGEYIPPRPQTPIPPFPYETREVKIVNPVDSAVLAGTLTLPLQYAVPMYKSFPAIVMVSGSGLQNRDEEIYGHKPFAVLANKLAMAGIASLRYDDRGYGESTGDVENATTETFAQDALAAVDYMKGEVERIGLVGVLGHSEGGLIAYMLAADSLVDFAISLAGPAVKGDSLLLVQNRRIMIPVFGADNTDMYITALSRVFDYMNSHPGAAEWPEIETALADLTTLTQAQTENLKAIIQDRRPWMEYFRNYDPAPMISRIQIPILAVNGEMDTQVDAEINLDTLRRLLADNPKAIVKEYPGLNHLFQHAKTGLPNEYGTIEETISDDVLGDIVKFVKKVQK